MSGAGAKARAGDIVRLTIEGLGGLGDGIARHQGVPVYVPLAAPGDIADVLLEGPRGDGVAGRLMTLARAGETRRAPPCPYFGACGGCALQHLAPDIYSRWKEGLVGAELARHSLAADIRPMRAPASDDPLALRRRAVFSAENRDGAVEVGFNARATRKIVPIGRCLLLTPALDHLIGALPELMETFLADGERGQAAVTDLAGSVDVLVVAPRPPGRHARERIAAIAARPGRGATFSARGNSPARHRIARVSWRAVKDENAAPDTTVQHEPCRVSLGGASVVFPRTDFFSRAPGARRHCNGW